MKNPFKKYTKAYKAEQERLKKLRSELDAEANKLLKIEKDKVQNRCDEYRIVFSKKFEFLGKTFIPYSVMHPFVHISHNQSDRFSDPIHTLDSVNKMFDSGEYFLTKQYITRAGDYIVWCYCVVGEKLETFEFTGQDKIDAVINNMEYL